MHPETLGKLSVPLDHLRPPGDLGDLNYRFASYVRTFPWCDLAGEVKAALTEFFSLVKYLGHSTAKEVDPFDFCCERVHEVGDVLLGGDFRLERALGS